MRSLFHSERTNRVQSGINARHIVTGVALSLGVFLSACAQTPPPAAGPVTPMRTSAPAPSNLSAHSEDMSVTIRMTGARGSLSNLMIRRPDGTMIVSFQIFNSGSSSLQLDSNELWSDKSSTPIDRGMDRQPLIVPPNSTQSFTISAPIPQARHLALELVAAH